MFPEELHEGVQDMACDTFLKISQSCKRNFVYVSAHVPMLNVSSLVTQVQAGETFPFIEEILSTMPSIVCDLEAHQV